MTIYEALKKDHEKLQSLLNELVLLKLEDEVRKTELLSEIRDELIPHSRAEESVFYNSLRALDKVKDIAMQSYKEHLMAETLLRTMQAKDKVNLDWQKTAKEFKEAIQHHIDEEETRIFNVAQQLFTQEEAEMMGEAFEALKPEIQEEGLLKTSLEMVTNLMPKRFVPAFRSINLDARL
jgi:hemerythrin-like domain-containing protein